MHPLLHPSFEMCSVTLQWACVTVFTFTLLYDVDVGDPDEVRVRARQNVSEKELDGKRRGSRVSLRLLPSSVEWPR
jgi:hypothetical protein